ncbi:hypothetical protein ABTE19_20595, partial [Acinetobacter baumannii]
MVDGWLDVDGDGVVALPAGAGAEGAPSCSSWLKSFPPSLRGARAALLLVAGVAGLALPASGEGITSD